MRALHDDSNPGPRSLPLIAASASSGVRARRERATGHPQCWTCKQKLTTYCLVLPSWTAEALSRHRCDNKSHLHISVAERDELLKNHLADLYCAKCGNPLELCACARGRFTIIRLRRIVALHGFSCRFGEFLSYARGTLLGKVMVAAIAMRPLESGD